MSGTGSSTIRRDAMPLPRDRFEAVVVTRYLQRDLFEPIRHAVTPGGIVLYETFTTDQRAHGCGPTYSVTRSRGPRII